MRTEIFDLPLLIENCPCNRTHRCEIETVVCGAGALERLPELLKGYASALFVSDRNTYAAAGERAGEIARKAGLTVRKLVYLDKTLLIPDENAAARLIEALKKSGCQVVVAVGSGVIGDICKYVCSECGLPQVTVATAPSMDGYASSVAAMLFGGGKTTFPAAVPVALLGDTNVLKAAPEQMLVSGIGDIVGKLSSLSDWNLAQAMTGEPLCCKVYDLVREQTDNCLSAVDGVMRREEGAVEALFSALCATGIGMSLVGSSRPASGSEHHIAHYFEVQGIRMSAPYLPHGIDVAYATAITAFLRQALCKDDRLYSVNDAETVAQILRQCPSEDDIWGILNKVGLTVSDFFNFYGKDRIREAIIGARLLKDRYTLLSLLHDRGLLHEYADAYISERAP